MITIMLQIC